VSVACPRPLRNGVEAGLASLTPNRQRTDNMPPRIRGGSLTIELVIILPSIISIAVVSIAVSR